MPWPSRSAIMVPAFEGHPAACSTAAGEERASDEGGGGHLIVSIAHRQGRCRFGPTGRVNRKMRRFPSLGGADARRPRLGCDWPLAASVCLSTGGQATSGTRRPVWHGLPAREHAGTGRRPEGTLECSHGWSESAAGGRTEPVESSRESVSPRKGRRKAEEEVYANPIRWGQASPLLRPVGAVSFGYVAIHGLRPPVGGLHPWLQPAAPCGAKAVVRKLRVRVRAQACGAEVRPAPHAETGVFQWRRGNARRDWRRLFSVTSWCRTILNKQERRFPHET